MVRVHPRQANPESFRGQFPLGSETGSHLAYTQKSEGQHLPERPAAEWGIGVVEREIDFMSSIFDQSDRAGVEPQLAGHQRAHAAGTVLHNGHQHSHPA